MICYKVVQTMNGSHYSILVTGKATTEYKEGKDTLPPKWLMKKGYGLCVFKTRIQADCFVAFSCHHCHVTVREVLINKKSIIKRLPLRSNIDMLSRGVVIPEEEPDRCTWPIGTSMVRRLKMLKKGR